jgi:hypothetical protein
MFIVKWLQINKRPTFATFTAFAFFARLAPPRPTGDGFDGGKLLKIKRLNEGRKKTGTPPTTPQKYF